MSVSSSQLNDFMGTIHLFSVERRLRLYDLNDDSKLKKNILAEKSKSARSIHAVTSYRCNLQSIE